MVMSLPVLYGNCEGGYFLTDRNWDGRIAAQVSLVNSSGAWMFLATEMHEEVGTGLPNGGHKYFLARLQAADPDWALFEGKVGNHCYYRPSHLAAVSRTNHNFTKDPRGYTDFTLRELTTNFSFHAVLSHMQANDNNGHDRTPERKRTGLELAKYCAKLTWAFVAVDMNSSTERSGYPRDSFENNGFQGLRQRGAVTNGDQSTRSTSSSADYWIEDIWTRTAQNVSGSALVKTNGASDHNGWLKTTITWDVAATSGPTGPTPPPASTLPQPDLLRVTDQTARPWTASVRYPDYTLGGPVKFTTATLVENYNAPDMLSLSGRQLSEIAVPGYGVVLQDEHGIQRFSGIVTSIEKNGNGVANLIFTGDMVGLWWRVCYPVPANPWTTAGQTLDHDNVTASAEAKIISYVNRNAGPGARAERKLPYPDYPILRMPASQNRGPSALSSVRFDILGQLVATLAESANLRARVVQTFSGTTPHLDLILTSIPDLSDWASFGTPEGGGPWMLSPDWRYKIDLPVTTAALSAAGGQGTARILNSKTDQDATDLWKARVETLVDQRDTTDATEITNGLVDAMTSGAGPTEVAVPIGRVPGLGTTIPLGAKVTATLDGDPIVDRIRQITTVISKTQGEPTVKVTAVLGTPDVGVKSPTQRKLADALRRIQNLEKS